MTDDIKILQKELKAERKRNDVLIDKMAHLEKLGPPVPSSSGSKNSSSGELVKKRSFDQLVKEVDQCFAELGRQVQREAKHRQNMEEQIDQIQHESMNPTQSGTKLDDDVDKRLIKLENTLSETKKDMKKERKKLEKTISSQDTGKLDQQTIEDTIQTIMVDVVDELTSNEARIYESVERRIKDLEEVVDQTERSRSLTERKTNNEVRRLGVIVDSAKLSHPATNLPGAADLTVDVPNVAEDLRITMGSLQEKTRLLDEQQQEHERRLGQSNQSFKKDLESFRSDMAKSSKVEKELDRRMNTVEKNVTTGINAPGRTVSIGPNPTDVTTLRKQINQLEEKHDKLKSQLENRPVPSSVISPGLSKLNENVVDLENSVSSLRTEVEADRNRLENVRHESQSKIRALREDLRTLRPKLQPVSPVEVIVSTDNPEHDKKGPSMELNMSKAEIDAIISKIAKLEKQGLFNNSPSMGQTEFMHEVEILSDENQRLWRTLTKIEESMKNLTSQMHEIEPSDDPSVPGALASAINRLQTQITAGGPEQESLENRMKRIERELADKSDRGTDRIWRHLSNLEEQMTRRHGETDERITLIESHTDSGLDSDNVVVPDEKDDDEDSAAFKQKRADMVRYWSELGSLKAKVSEIIGRDLLDIKKSLNTSAQRAEVRRLALDIENMKGEFIKPMDEKLQKLGDEFNKKRKNDQKIKHSAPMLEIIPNNRGTTSHSITKTDMKEFEEKLETFKNYWIDESEKYVKLNLLEHLTEDLERLKEQIMDVSDAEKRDIKSIENKLEVFAEDIENSVDSGRAADREYVDEKIKTMQKHGISAAALEDIATLQHRLAFIVTTGYFTSYISYFVHG